MDLTLLAHIPPWEWPPNGGSTLLAVLDDPQARESDRLLAAELAGEVVIIDDDLAGILMSLVGDSAASEPLRCRAALSLGPVLDQMDLDSDDYYLRLDEDALGPPPISGHTFRRIQDTLRVRYLEDDVPPNVRRHILEASARAPADWHGDAIRAAYAREDREWRLTAVCAMGYVDGFDAEILAALDGSRRRGSVRSGFRRRRVGPGSGMAARFLPALSAGHRQGAPARRHRSGSHHRSARSSTAAACIERFRRRRNRRRRRAGREDGRSRSRSRGRVG